MRYDKNENGHFFRNTNIPSTVEELRNRTNSVPTQKKISAYIFTAIMIVSIILPRLFRGHIVPGTMQAQIVLLSFVLLFAGIIMTFIQNPKMPIRVQKNTKIIGIVIGIIGLICTAITILVVFNIVEFEYNEESFILVITGICILIFILCFFGGLISLISSRVKYTESDTAVCIGYDDKIFDGTNSNIVYSSPVYELNIDGSRYLVYEDKYDVASRLPHIDDQVSIKYNPNNPYDCVIGKIKNGLAPLFISIPLLLMIAGLLLPILHDHNLIGFGSDNVPKKNELVASDYYKKINKFALDDKFLEDVLEIDGKDHTFEVYVREVEKIDGDFLIFDEYEGLDSRVENHYTDSVVGEDYYWIQRDDGLVLILKKSSCAYNGNNLVD